MQPLYCTIPRLSLTSDNISACFVAKQVDMIQACGLEQFVPVARTGPVCFTSISPKHRLLNFIVRTVRLLGTEVIFTGIRPEVVQTLVGLGVEL